MARTIIMQGYEDDYHAGLKYSLPMLVPVNEKGQFVSTVENWAGMNVFDADHAIVKYLNEKGFLLAQENITHSYPHCWRCKQKVIFRATPQWFLDIEKENLRGRLIHAVRNVKWIPEICQSRILGMLETRPDWCLSRQRAWGVPVPVVYCSECGIPAMTDEIMSNFRELIRKENSDVWYKVPMEKLVPEDYTCPNCGSKNFQKGRDILDVWFDSGVSHQAVLRSNPDLGFPSDMYFLPICIWRVLTSTVDGSRPLLYPQLHLNRMHLIAQSLRMGSLSMVMAGKCQSPSET